MPRRHRLVAKPQPADHAGAESLHEHVGAFQQPPQHVTPGRRLQVESDALLAEVAHHGKGCVAAWFGSTDPHPVPAIQHFDLDDGGAILCQQHSGVRRGDPLAEVDDFDPGKRCIVAHVFVASRGQAIRFHRNRPAALPALFG